jgi:hypothetical protein
MDCCSRRDDADTTWSSARGASGRDPAATPRPRTRRCRGSAASDGDDERQFGLESEHSLRYLEVEVSWSDGTGQKSYTLKSLRLASEEDEE